MAAVEPLTIEAATDGVLLDVVGVEPLLEPLAEPLPVPLPSHPP